MTSTNAVVTPKPKPAEVRAVWVSNTAILDWNTATRDLQRAGYNTMYVNLASGGAAFYPGSKVLPSLINEKPDPIARGVELARQRGISVHAKQIVMFMFKAPVSFQKQLVDAGRVMLGPTGQPVLQAGNAWLCPSQPVNRTMSIAAINEMLTRYPVGGLQFDYIRFYEEPCCYCAHCRKSFETYAGKKFEKWPTPVISGNAVEKFQQWKQEMINDWCRELSVAARKARPGIVVTAAVFSDLDRSRVEKGQDWRLWLQRGWLDQVCTMTYVTDATQFETLLRKQQVWAPKREQLVAGIGSWKFETMQPLQNQIAISRKHQLAGFALFSYDDAATRNFLPIVATK